ncbi:decapping and exoribonuclease protein-like isoform X2 [Calliopsis andreniformis]|uniref:decapping and exoribonuclease protein-like isoform X2 n=1 Tax=Calliopsis andreniformis TaxID=337506 RepID=UPI003FCD53C2
MLFKFKIADLAKESTAEFSKPQIIGHYSIDGERRYFSDLSQLKYYKQPLDLKHVNFNLDDNSQTVYKEEDVDVKLDFLLKWISENFKHLEMREDSGNSTTSRCLEPEFICNRGSLTNLFITPYNCEDGWMICASKFKGTIYLCSFDTDEKKREKLKRTEYHKRCIAWGYKFEQYMLSDTPSTNPDLTTPLNQNEEFCCVFKSNLVNKDVELIELKTIPERSINYQGHINHRRPLTTLKWWCQSYLVGIKRIICGCKKGNSGIVFKIKEFLCSELVNSSKNLWRPEICTSFCNEFLERMKLIVQKDYNKCIYQFEYKPNTRYVEVNEIEPSFGSEYTFLPMWYIAKANQHFSARV